MTQPGENPELKEQIRRDLEVNLGIDSLTDRLHQEAIEKGLTDPIVVRTNNPQWPFTVIERPPADKTIPITAPMWISPTPGLERSPKSTMPIRAPGNPPPTPGLER